MTYTGKFATILDVTYKAGINANTTLLGDLYQESFQLEAEGLINTQLFYNFTAVYDDLVTEVKGVLKDICSSLMAMSVVAGDMSGYTSRAEAETLLDKLNNDVNRGLSILRNSSQKEFLKKEA